MKMQKASFVLALAALFSVACKSKSAAPPPAGTCSFMYTGGKKPMRTCSEIRNAAILDAQERACKAIDGAVFTKGEPCPTGGRVIGCATANGNIEWRYDVTEDEARQSCVMSRLVFVDQPVPPMGSVADHHCMNPEKTACDELRSIVDEAAKSEKDVCTVMQPGTFAPGTCPIANVVGRCLVGDQRTRAATRIFYAPGYTAERARKSCEAALGKPE